MQLRLQKLCNSNKRRKDQFLDSKRNNEMYNFKITFIIIDRILNELNLYCILLTIHSINLQIINIINIIHLAKNNNSRLLFNVFYQDVFSNICLIFFNKYIISNITWLGLSFRSERFIKGLTYDFPLLCNFIHIREGVS